MKKISTKFIKILMLISMVFSSLQNPIYVLADELQADVVMPEKGDMKLGLNGEVTKEGKVTVTKTNEKTGEGAVSVTKTVSKVDNNGKYQVKFKIIGQDYSTSTNRTLPSYTVFVLDASGSMKGNRWTNAKSAAINFSQKLIEAGEYTEAGVVKNTNNIALATFDGSLLVSKDFSQTAFIESDLGNLGSGTNYQAGFDKAYEYLSNLSEEVKENSSLNVIFISDGKPNRGNCTSVNTCATSLAALKALGDGVNIYTFAYELYDSGAINVLKSISTNDKVESVTSDNIDEVLAGFVETVSGSTPAGVTNSFVDNLGDKFKIVDTSKTYDFGDGYTDNVEKNITEDGIEITFNIQIDVNAETGWYNTNDGFELVYVDSKTGNEEKITCDENPYVYWESFRYKVNYYKDSIDSGNLIGTDEKIVDKGTVINASGINKEKYLTQELINQGYKYDSVMPESIVVDNSLEIPVINVLYTLKEYGYKVEYYYDNQLVDTDSYGPVTHGYEVDPTDYYLDNSDIRVGYKLDEENTDSEIVVIDSEEEVIRIYYIKDNFEYTVNYHFGVNEVIDNSNTNNTGKAEFGSLIDPMTKYLTQDELINKGYGEYFLNPNKPHLPGDGLVVGADASKNIIDIYYINTEVKNETTTKTADRTVISSSSELVQYTVNYKANVSNVRKDEVIIVTIVDTLPKKINESLSELNGGVYNESNNTITWTFEMLVDEFTENYSIDKTVMYKVNYQDFANMSSSVNNMLLNTVKGMVTINNDISNGAEDDEEVEVAIDGKLIVKHVDELGNELVPSVTTTNKVGTSYNESKKDIYGYSIVSEPDNKTGEYIEGTITVTFVYSKNTGEVVDNQVEKTGLESVTGIGENFEYVLKYSAKVEDYVGDVTLTLTDKLPYELDLEKSTFDNRCEVNGQTLVCSQVIAIDEDNTEINEEFKLSLVFKNITEGKVVNEVVANLKYGDKEIENDDKTETEVLKGEVIATYKDTLGNVLAEEIKTSDLAGKEYVTSEKEIYGYTLTETPENKTGKYVAEEVIYVNYVYSKNTGSVDLNKVVKLQENPIIGVNSTFKYVLSYSGKVLDYVGDVTLTLTDKLPYEVLDIKYADGCSYDEETRLLVCEKVVQLDEDNQDIKAEFEIEVTYKNLSGTTDLTIVNKVESKLTFGSTEVEDESEVSDVVNTGKVVAEYVSEDGTVLADDEETTGLIDTEYKTSEKEIYGYTLTETPENESGKYTEKTITVTYVYSKNTGEVVDNQVEKTGLDKVTGVGENFDYVLRYSAKVEDYVGDVTLTLTDKLPYELDLEKSLFDNRCEVNGQTLVCSQIIAIDEDNTEINEEFKLSLVFKNITDSKVVNEVVAKLVYGDKEIENEDKTETEVLKGEVIATYKDTLGNVLAEEIKTSDLAGKEYVTSEKEIYGYTLTETPENKTGKYVAEEVIYVNYVYSKNTGEVVDNQVEKTGLDKVTGVGEEFDYVLKYSAKVEDYVGDVTLTLTDKLPYELDLEKSLFDNRCEVNGKTLVCSQIITIDEENTEINEEFKLSLVFKNITEGKVVNEVVAKLVYGDKEIENEDKTETEVLKGEVIATYKDTLGNVLAEEIKTSNLAGKEYVTSEKEIYGYTLTEIPENKIGKYVAEETVYVNYVYSKNTGSVVENEVLKTQKNPIVGVNSMFKYVLSYSGKVLDYVGEAKITLTDKLPYEILNIKYSDGCSYDEETGILVCEKVVQLDEDNQDVKAEFEIEVTYKDLVGTTNLNVLNKVESKLTFGSTEVEDESEVSDVVNTGKVVAEYVSEDGTVLADDEETTGLIDTEYKTSEKEIYGYTLIETPENESGKYTEKTIIVTYVYSKNTGEVVDNQVEKTGLDKVTGIGENFDYVLKYSAKVEDYVGDVTLTLTDKLPYELDLEKSTFDNRCEVNGKTLVCSQVIAIDEDNTEINEEFKLSLVFKNITEGKVVNEVVAKLVYGDKEIETEDKTETEVLKGEVIATYKDTLGNVLAEEIKTSDLAGAEYKTYELEFLGYTLTEIPENKIGKYVANETIYVNYVYSKNVGTSEEELVKTGSELVVDINKPFEYVITYNTEIFDYVGEVEIVIVDTPEHEIDEEKSVIGNNCQFVNGEIVCKYKLNIINKEDGIINITENLILYYKNITDNLVNNKVSSTLIYGSSIKTNDSEWDVIVASGDVVVNYVTVDGDELADSIITSGLVGTQYQTEEKAFDGYYLHEVVGNEEGMYTEEIINVTYVYSKIPLPPQTGVENNFSDYISLLISIIFLFVIRKRI